MLMLLRLAPFAEANYNRAQRVFAAWDTISPRRCRREVFGRIGIWISPMSDLVLIDA